MANEIGSHEVTNGHDTIAEQAKYMNVTSTTIYVSAVFSQKGRKIRYLFLSLLTYPGKPVPIISC